MHETFTSIWACPLGETTAKMMPTCPGRKCRHMGVFLGPFSREDKPAATTLTFSLVIRASVACGQPERPLGNTMVHLRRNAGAFHISARATSRKRWANQVLDVRAARGPDVLGTRGATRIPRNTRVCRVPGMPGNYLGYSRPRYTWVPSRPRTRAHQAGGNDLGQDLLAIDEDFPFENTMPKVSTRVGECNVHNGGTEFTTSKLQHSERS